MEKKCKGKYCEMHSNCWYFLYKNKKNPAKFSITFVEIIMFAYI